MDAELLKQIDKYWKSEMNSRDITTCKSMSFATGGFKFDDESKLKELSDQIITIRTQLLVKFSKAFMKAYKFINTNDKSRVGSIAHLHFKSKGYSIPSLMSNIIKDSLA